MDCTHCGRRMTSHLGSGTRIRYFHCASCLRWVSSSYTEVFRADAKVRAVPASGTAAGGQFDAVKQRLEAWFAALDKQDPYRAIGASPTDSPESIRSRYRALALENHPDRGGDPEAMRELNFAYERISRHRGAREAPETGARSLPAPHR